MEIEGKGDRGGLDTVSKDPRLPHCSSTRARAMRRCDGQ